MKNAVPVSRLPIFISVCTFAAASGVAATPAGIHLVSARSSIEGSFVGHHAIHADADRIYLASFQGRLFVLARDRAADFPLVQVVQDTAAPLTAVGGDRDFVYDAVFLLTFMFLGGAAPPAPGPYACGSGIADPLGPCNYACQDHP